MHLFNGFTPALRPAPHPIDGCPQSRRGAQCLGRHARKVRQFIVGIARFPVHRLTCPSPDLRTRFVV
jgi:hypothetical protein